MAAIAPVVLSVDGNAVSVSGGQSLTDDARARRYFEAILCTLVAQAGGSIRLDASAIAAWGNDARLWIKAAGPKQQVSLGLDFGPWQWLLARERWPWHRSPQ